jgi:hypothetical protein
MSNTLRRFEILLPLRFNDGQPVPDELIGQTLLEIREHFGAVSAETQVIRGHWQHQGEVFRDELVRVFVDVPDTEKNRTFFAAYKEQLKTRLRQLDIWMTTYLGGRVALRRFAPRRLLGAAPCLFHGAAGPSPRAGGPFHLRFAAGRPRSYACSVTPDAVGRLISLFRCTSRLTNARGSTVRGVPCSSLMWNGSFKTMGGRASSASPRWRPL